MTTFFLVRHGSCCGLGETLWGRTDGVRLNKEGKAEALRLAERFTDVKLDAIYSSPLERALETAEAIARVAKLEVKQSPAFNEIDFGEWSGRSFEVLAAAEHWRRFNSRRSVTKIPGGESFLDVQARVVAELERLSQQHAGGRIAIVSHADVIKAAVGYVAGTPIDLLQRFEISPCSVSIIATDEHETRMLALNSRCELM
ncbi:MAG TPA: histidine phosphatase family protein [Pyrinomonadaceae bacterium]|nr:histidine phosphatase family protein [Pyrinomonadaceae bacterium]